MSDEQWAACVAGLKAITALDRNLPFVLETHGKTLADTGPSARRLMAAVAAFNRPLRGLLTWGAPIPRARARGY